MIRKKLRSIIGPISILILCLKQTVFAQNLVQQAQKDVEWLCSDSLAGRGFQKNGMQNAALWLCSEYGKAGLKPLGDSFLQELSVEVNLPEKYSFQVGTTHWVAGKDYLIHASSGNLSSSTKYITCNGSTEDWQVKKAKCKNKWVVILEDKGQKNKSLSFQENIDQAKESQAQGILFIREKLTHTYSPTQNLIAVVECKLDKWQEAKAKKIESNIFTKISQNICANVVAVSPAENATYPDSFVVFCAHYDHLGMMGPSIFRGANDNASGTAFLLALARKLKDIKTTYRIILISFAAEEAGLKGSLHFVKNPLVDLTKIKFVLNFDLMGNGQNGVMAVGAETFPILFDEVQAAKPKNGQMKDLAKRPNAANSDHYPFTLKNIPALFFYTMGGPPHYHDVFDEVKGLEFTIFEEFHQWMLNLIEQK